MHTRNSTESRPRKTAPHHRITISDVVRDFKEGLLTPSGAIFYFIASSRKIGQSVKVSRKQICELFEMSQSSYYRAIALLSERYRLKISAPDEMTLRIPVSTEGGTPDYILVEECSQIWESDSQNWESDSQIWESDSQNWEADSQNWENQSRDRAVQADSGGSQLDQLDQSFKQLTTELVSPTPRPVMNELEESGIELTENQLSQLQAFSEEQVRQAIEVVRGSKQVKDKVKFFFKALRNGWRSKLPRATAPDFRNWFEQMREQGKAIASMSDESGEIIVLMSNGQWVPLDVAMSEGVTA